ncbi:uncharacterized protein Aud_010101 [Aspergillus udagawae]|uniref:3-oxoacyl-[acyl-carrier-protein] reductase FabG n=1 Tax=Aspergillus udagawae TaxID=91492 RepID=A0A8E0V3H3_9EURO|nr:uncharacterized protein Aud_010101 [Aspergillus udagawae]GIC93613.1 hypothetical protein Aud_010101 [Aspergillus udagawae]
MHCHHLPSAPEHASATTPRVQPDCKPGELREVLLGVPGEHPRVIYLGLLSQSSSNSLSLHLSLLTKNRQTCTTTTSPKVALITGASRGVGAAIARCLAEEGMNIVINYNSDPAAAERVLQEMRASNQAKGPGANVSHYAAIQANLADRSGIQQLVQQTIQAMGRLDVVVSNVGWTRMTNFMTLDHVRFAGSSPRDKL